MLKNIIAEIKKFHKDDAGDIVQTAIITAVLAVLAVGGYTFLAPKVKSLFNKTGGQLDQTNSYSY